MKGVSVDDAVALLESLLARPRWKRLLAGRFFRGHVAGVTGTGPYLVTLIRPGDTAPDGNTYLCAAPGYGPTVGDDVECVWLDDSVGMVLWPVANQALGAKIAQQNAQAALANAATVALVFDTILWDPRGMADLTAPGTITIPITGRYMMTAAVSFALNNTPVQIAIAVNGGVHWPACYGGSAVGTAVGMRPQVNVVDILLAGWVLTAMTRQDSGGSLAPQASTTLTYLSVQYMSA